MNKTLRKIIISVMLVLLLFTVAFLVLVYCHSEYEQYKKLHGGDLVMRDQSNQDFIMYMTFIYPALLYAFLGNRYLRIVKKIPYKTVKEKIIIVIYTLLFFMVGEFITYIPVNIFLQIIYLLYCRVMNLEIFGFTTATGSLWGIFSCAVAVFSYQILLEKHLQSIEKDATTVGK